jgi:hypothetical protein
MADFTSSLMINVTDSRLDSVLYPKSELFKDDGDGESFFIFSP